MSKEGVDLALVRGLDEGLGGWDMTVISVLMASFGFVSVGWMSPLTPFVSTPSMSMAARFDAPCNKQSKSHLVVKNDC